jgi:hypothetical protein
VRRCEKVKHKWVCYFFETSKCLLFSPKKMASFTQNMYWGSWRKLVIALVFKIKSLIFDENWRKSLKILIVGNVDPRWFLKGNYE